MFVSKTNDELLVKSTENKWFWSYFVRSPNLIRRKEKAGRKINSICPNILNIFNDQTEFMFILPILLPNYKTTPLEGGTMQKNIFLSVEMCFLPK